MVWLFKLPDYFYAMTAEGAETEQEARQFVREWLNIKRVPNGTEFWQNNASWARDIARQNRRAGFNARTDF